MPPSTTLVSDIWEFTPKNLFATRIISKLKLGNLLVEEQEKVNRFVLDQETGLLLYDNLIYVPDKLGRPDS